jgi:TolA-binding protein
MHAINGTTDLTDVMFDWNMQISMTMFMVDAGNLNGAQMSIAKIPDAYKMAQKFVAKKADAEFDKSFAAIDTLYNEWVTAMNVKNYDKAKEVFKSFSASFPIVFKQSI